jgi:hypothetical protein
MGPRRASHFQTDSEARDREDGRAFAAIGGTGQVALLVVESPSSMSTKAVALGNEAASMGNGAASMGMTASPPPTG